MRQILDFLVGKKTYMMIAVTALDSVGVQQGWWAEGGLRQVVEMALAAAFLRAGVNTSAAGTPVPFISTGVVVPPAVK